MNSHTLKFETQKNERKELQCIEKTEKAKLYCLS